MTISTFKFGSRYGTCIKLPLTRTQSVKWRPQIHDRFPDFTALTTKGEISFSTWASGHWTVVVSHPAAFTPVCTSEIAMLAKRLPEFNERNVRLMAITGDPLERIQKWTSDIEALHDVHVDFPHVADRQGVIANGCGLLNEEPLLEGSFCARRTFLIDPKGTIKMIFDYPVSVGRSVDEILRVLDALILSERVGALAPADWHLGEPLMLLRADERPDLVGASEESRKTDRAYFRSDFNLKEGQRHSRKGKASRLPILNAKEINQLDTRQRQLVITRLVQFQEQ